MQDMMLNQKPSTWGRLCGCLSALCMVSVRPHGKKMEKKEIMQSTPKRFLADLWDGSPCSQGPNLDLDLDDITSAPHSKDTHTIHSEMLHQCLMMTCHKRCGEYCWV